MKSVKDWNYVTSIGNRVDIECDGRHVLHIFILEDDLVRVLLKKDKGLRLDRTWCIAPEGDDGDWYGRDRLSTKGFSLPDYNIEIDGNRLRIMTDLLRLTVERPLRLDWEYKNDMGEWVTLASDRKNSAYMLGVKDDAVSHFMSRSLEDRYYGLGEKTGNLNRANKRYQMCNMDSMGYDAERTDPLYKHIPFYITQVNKVSYGIFYDNLATCWLDMGNELDNYHGYYRSYRAEDGDLDYYMIYGPTVLDVTKRYTRLTGRTALGPKWSLGFSGSTMHYTDANNAQEQLLQFVKLCRQHGIPCDSFQLSSGYTSINDKRYVFNWNYSKVPDPEKLAADFHQEGMRLAANIKPCLLQDHPRFAEVKEKGLFVKDSESNEPELSQFWDDEGSHLDFTNPETISWWMSNVTEQLLQKGIDSTWNDNNEFEIWDSNARCAGFGNEVPIKLIRPLQTLLMMRASFEAQMKYSEDTRPYLISRSGCAGMHRYAQTWSGDNSTSWKTLRYNIKMGLGMSLSGIYNLGHDVGGFSGERPEPELFARWVQNGIMHPRFTIHSWNDDGTVNEPWMYPEITPIVREAMTLRYRLMPYIYNVLWQAHDAYEPMLRPTFLDHEHDSRTFEECDDFLLGQDLLVASVVEKGQRYRDVYLPDNRDGWYDFHRHEWYGGGQTVTLPAPLEELPLLARAGSVIPTSSRIDYVDSSLDDQRQLLVFPFKGVGQRKITIFDDDGESFSYRQGDCLHVIIDLKCDNHSIELNISKSGSWSPAYQGFVLQLPMGERRPLFVNGIRYEAGGEFLLAEVS
ncbi:glycoside hydrolase family 31 protein [Halomonas sp. EGI 63088]|uniref:Glycoside hydrolase family 31 protein n=2 Tax=Halomonas flagellata TaxID=2920385 RepID=A0ABS9S043_9GAMM|nr:glycoside hydrolase family 31 protein [Halomonas flagellata]